VKILHGYLKRPNTGLHAMIRPGLLSFARTCKQKNQLTLHNRGAGHLSPVVNQLLIRQNMGIASEDERIEGFLWHDFRLRTVSGHFFSASNVPKTTHANLSQVYLCLTIVGVG